MGDTSNGGTRSGGRVWGALLATSGLILATGVAALATPPKGLNRTDLAKGTLSESMKLETGGPTDVYMRRVTVEPGGTTGWHSHPGAEVNVVTKGAVTIFFGDDPTCAGHPIQTGAASFVPGGRVHLGVNDGTEPAELYVTAYLPKDSQPVKDEAQPVQCSRS